MPFTNLALGTNWPRDEWPESVDAMHEGACDSLRYVPERTCKFEPHDFEDGAFTHMVIKCSNCGLRLEPEISGSVPSFVNYCPNCGARVVEE